MSKRQEYRRKKAPFRESARPAHTRKPIGADVHLIYGFHAAEAAILNPKRTIHRVRATRSAAQRLSAALSKRGLTADLVETESLNALLGEQAVHQGIVLEVAPLQPIPVEDLAPVSPLLVLDQVTDPHNVGAILRSAAAFGAGAVIVQDRHSPPPTGALAKAATGALEYVHYIQVTNIARTLEQLKRDGYWVVGLDGNADTTIEDALKDPSPVCLVLGAEGSGLRRLTAENCDILARFELPGAIKALNVSNAAALALYVARASSK